jgi:hypothetical protein
MGPFKFRAHIYFFTLFLEGRGEPFQHRQRARAIEMKKIQIIRSIS